MFLTRFVAVQMFISSIPSAWIHCSAQQATSQARPHSAASKPNTTTLLQQLPTNLYLANFNDKNYRSVAPQHNTPAVVAKYRNLGNYYQDVEQIAALPVSSLPGPTNKKLQRRHTVHSIPVRFDNHVLHLSHQKATRELRPRRYTNVTSIVTPSRDQLIKEKQAFVEESEEGERGKQVKSVIEGEGQPTTIETAQSYHDIFMRFNGPHHTSFGHVEFNPNKNFQKRFESLNNNDGNRHRGEIVWTDAQGGYGEHHWDLMQGRLR